MGDVGATSLLDRAEVQPVDLDDTATPPEEYDPDPQPVPERRRGRLRGVVKAPPAAPVSRRRIATELEVYLQLAAAPVTMRDQVCGPVIEQQAKPLAEALAGLICRYPDFAAKITASGILGDCIKVLVAARPIFAVVWAHHLRRSDAEGGDSDSAGTAPVDTRYQPFRPATA